MTRLFINCDWGTSGFRLRLADAATLRVLGEHRSAAGTARLAAETTPATRAAACAQELIRGLEELARSASEPVPGVPILISGMASSSIGWRELPYAKLPLPLDGRGLTWEDLGPLPAPWEQARVVLISGVRSDCDVMRGEETEAMGVASLSGVEGLLDRCLLIMTGTHAKHLYVEGGRMIAFQTYMTGELFDVLRGHSSLQHSTGGSRPPLDELAGPHLDAFHDGLATAMDRPLSAALFHVRTRQLLGGGDAESNAAFLSGALIGAEVDGLRRCWPMDLPLILCARPALLASYRTALEWAGMSSRLYVVDAAEVDRLSLLGQAALVQRIFVEP